jgi:hypothetical protein
MPLVMTPLMKLRRETACVAFPIASAFVFSAMPRPLRSDAVAVRRLWEQNRCEVSYLRTSIIEANVGIRKFRILQGARVGFRQCGQAIEARSRKLSLCRCLYVKMKFTRQSKGPRPKSKRSRESVMRRDLAAALIARTWRVQKWKQIRFYSEI